MYIDVIVIRIIRAECCRTVAIAAMIFHLYQTHAHAFLAIDNVMWYGRCSWCPRNWSHFTLFWRLINYLLFLSTSLHFTFTHEWKKKPKITSQLELSLCRLWMTRVRRVRSVLVYIFDLLLSIVICYYYCSFVNWSERICRSIQVTFRVDKQIQTWNNTIYSCLCLPIGSSSSSTVIITFYFSFLYELYRNRFYVRRFCEWIVCVNFNVRSRPCLEGTEATRWMIRSVELAVGVDLWWAGNQEENV